MRGGRERAPMVKNALAKELMANPGAEEWRRNRIEDKISWQNHKWKIEVMLNGAMCLTYGVAEQIEGMLGLSSDILGWQYCTVKILKVCMPYAFLDPIHSPGNFHTGSRGGRKLNMDIMTSWQLKHKVLGIHVSEPKGTRTSRTLHIQYTTAEHMHVSKYSPHYFSFPLIFFSSNCEPKPLHKHFSTQLWHESSSLFLKCVQWDWGNELHLPKSCN